MKPRVLLVPYADNWSYGFNAREIAKVLEPDFECRVVYKRTPGAELRAWAPDLAVDFWWKGHVRRLVPRAAVLKQVSSHRWQHERFGALDVRGLAVGHLAGIDGVIVPSLRLRAELASVVNVRVTPKGFDPALFGNEQRRAGGLSIGWAGKADALDKRLDLLRAAAPDLRIAGGDVPRDWMPAFYNGLDVIAIASEAEGDPLPLIEGMACGCFPVTTDVGIVPELVRHGFNGLVVQPTAQAFSKAFQWCRDNLDLVREAGRVNALFMRTHRTWAAVAPAWREAFQAAIAARRL